MRLMFVSTTVLINIYKSFRTNCRYTTNRKLLLTLVLFIFLMKIVYFINEKMSVNYLTTYETVLYTMFLWFDFVEIRYGYNIFKY